MRTSFGMLLGVCLTLAVLHTSPLASAFAGPPGGAALATVGDLGHVAWLKWCGQDQLLTGMGHGGVYARSSVSLGSTLAGWDQPTQILQVYYQAPCTYYKVQSPTLATVPEGSPAPTYDLGAELYTPDQDLFWQEAAAGFYQLQHPFGKP